MGNYYDQLLIKIQSLIDSEQYSAAKELIDDELAMPYVPANVLEQLEEMHIVVETNLVKSRPATLLSPEEVLEALRKGKEHSYAALKTLSLANIRTYSEVIKIYVDNPESDRLIVSLLLELLQQQQVNIKIDYYDNNQKKSCNPANLPAVFDQLAVVKIIAKLDRYFGNENPSFLKQCQMALANEVYMRYPELIDENQTDIITLAIIQYVYKAYGDLQGWQKFVQENNIQQNIDQVLRI